MTEPRHLTDAEVLTWSVVLAWRSVQERAGITILLLPYPPCPACGGEVHTVMQEYEIRQDFDGAATLALAPCGCRHRAILGQMKDVASHQAAMLDALHQGADWYSDDIAREAQARVGEEQRGPIVGHATIGIDAAATQAPEVRASTEPLASGLPHVAGRCPACHGGLFLADGGHVTCSRLDCPDPCAADDWLHGRTADPNPPRTSEPGIDVHYWRGGEKINP